MSPDNVFIERLARLGDEFRRDEKACQRYLGNIAAGTKIARAEWRALAVGYAAAAEAVEALLKDPAVLR